MNDMLGLYGLLRHAVPLPALVLRQELTRSSRPCTTTASAACPTRWSSTPIRRSPISCATTRSRLQVLTIAHVYGHNDFFKNNFTFRSTRAEYTIETFKSHADRVRHYVEDPSIGLEKVERFSTPPTRCRSSAGAISRSRKLTPTKSSKTQARGSRSRRTIRFTRIHRRQEYGAAGSAQGAALAGRGPAAVHPRPQSASSREWEKDLLTIVHERSAVFHSADRNQDHERRLGELLAQAHPRDSRICRRDLHLEFLVRHNQVLRPIPGSLNPYHVGMKIWEDIEKRWRRSHRRRARKSTARARKTARRKSLKCAKSSATASFLRRYLTEELIRELNLFEYKSPAATSRWSADVADEDSWREIKETLDSKRRHGDHPGHQSRRCRLRQQPHSVLKHDHDGRDLQLEYAEKTLRYVSQLWGRDVAMDTVLDGRKHAVGFFRRQIRHQESRPDAPRFLLSVAKNPLPCDYWPLTDLALWHP